MTLSAEVFAGFIAKIFVGYDAELMDVTKNAMIIYSLSFLLCGFNVFASTFLIGLENGKLSAIIYVLRTLVIQVSCIYVLPLI